MYPTSSIGSEGIVVRVVVVILACWSSHTYALMLITPNSYRDFNSFLQSHTIDSCALLRVFLFRVSSSCPETKSSWCPDLRSDPLHSVASVLTSFRCVRLDVFLLRPSWRLSASFVHVPRSSFSDRDRNLRYQVGPHRSSPCLASPRLTGSLQQLRQTCIYYRCCHYSKSTSASMIVLN